ncbi:Do family serine endopeptidase [Alsobacter sp. R-9]
MTNSSMSRRTLRNGLMAGAAAVAIVGAGLTHQAWLPSDSAFAQAQTQAMARATVNPGFADVVDRVKPAVVAVKVKVENASMRGDGVADDGEGPSFDDLPPGIQKFFREFGQRGEGRGMAPQQRPRGKQFAQSQGSGFFISQDGYIVTNNHVVQNGVEVQVTMDDGRTLDAKVIGTDPKTDLAVLKVKQEGKYPFVRFAPGQPRVGDWVIAVGNPFGLGGSVTAGIVSAQGRDIGSGPYDDYLQIDAAVNRGNSGGPTFDVNGDVVGVNTAIYSPSGGNVGIAFAIPTEVAQSVVEQLKSGGTVSRGFIGVQIQPVSQEIADSLGLKDTKGALVAEAQPDGPAAAAGIKAGDTIIAVDGKPVPGPRDLSREIGAKKPGANVALGVVRDGKEQTIQLKLGNLPGDKQAKADIGHDGADGKGFGLQLAPASTVKGAGDKGVVVTNVDPDGIAAAQGLKSGDVILEVAGKAVSQPGEVKKAVDEAKKEGRKAVLMRVKSGEGSRFVALAFQGRDNRG